MTWVRLHRGGFRKTLERIGSTPKSGIHETLQLAVAQDTAYALAVAIKFGPWWPKCLLRSLTLGWFLARRGIPFEVRIGVPGSGVGDRTVDFTAHAWVELQGVVLNDSPDVAEKYQAFSNGDRG